MYQRMQYYFGCLCLNPSSATGRGSTWKEYLYYSTTSTQTPYNPLYRLDIPSRKTHGECSRGERERERERGGKGIRRRVTDCSLLCSDRSHGIPVQS